jgi:hypothetical protein
MYHPTVINPEQIIITFISWLFLIIRVFYFVEFLWQYEDNILTSTKYFNSLIINTHTHTQMDTVSFLFLFVIIWQDCMYFIFVLIFYSEGTKPQTEGERKRCVCFVFRNLSYPTHNQHPHPTVNELPNKSLYISTNTYQHLNFVHFHSKFFEKILISIK